MPFAPWADEAAERAAVRDALGILADALVRCRDEDMRTEEVMAVLEFLEPRIAKPAFVRNFRNALNCEEPYSRWQNANAALNGIRRQFGL